MDAQNANKMTEAQQVRATALEAAMWTIDQRTGKSPSPQEVISRALIFECYLLSGAAPRTGGS